MPNQATNYGLTKPLASEFYDVEVQNGSMDKTGAQMKTDADGIKDLQDGQKNKADLVGGKVPVERLPTMDCETKGTAEQIVATHDGNKKAHPYLLGRIEAYVTATQDAQDAADATLETVSKIAFTIDAVPIQNGALTYNGQAQSPSRNNYDPNAVALGGVTTDTGAGTYTATFTPEEKYQWSDGIKTAKQVTWKIDRASMAALTQGGNLTFNGFPQGPFQSGYDTGKMTLGGTATSTDAGSYNATLTPSADYKWGGGSTGTETMVWGIGKAARGLSLNRTSMELTAAKKAGTITVTRAGDGITTTTSNVSGVASMSVSGNTVTVTTKARGRAIITISVTAGTNHDAPANKTYSVEVTVPTKNPSGSDWATIREVSSAGLGTNYWAMDDMKEITINDKVGNRTFSNLKINVFIIGFSRNTAKEGSNLVHFQIGKIGTAPMALCGAEYGNSVNEAGYFHMNGSNTNAGGWNGCSKRKTLHGNTGILTSPISNSLMAAPPADLRAVMQPITKYTDNTDNSSNSTDNVTATKDYLFDLTEFEVFEVRNYANQYEQNSQQQYAYYRAGNSKIANNRTTVNTTVWWWFRSPSYSSNGFFVIVWADGPYNYSHAYNSGGLQPGFAA